MTCNLLNSLNQSNAMDYIVEICPEEKPFGLDLSKPTLLWKDNSNYLYGIFKNNYPLSLQH